MIAYYLKALSSKDIPESLVNKHFRKKYKYLLKSKYIFQKDLFYFCGKHYQNPGIFPIEIGVVIDIQEILSICKFIHEENFYVN